MTAAPEPLAPKLCKDGRWINQWSQCENPAIPKLDLVNGQHHIFSCAAARTTDDLCGPGATLFEARV